MAAENKERKVHLDFQIHTNKIVVANQPDIVEVDKLDEKAVVLNVSMLSASHILKKEHKKHKKYQGLKEELQRMWRVKASVVTPVIEALRAVTPKLGEWLQQIP